MEEMILSVKATLAGSDGDWYAAIINDNGTVTNRVLTNWNPVHNWANVMVADVNGDGRDDIVGASDYYGDVDWYAAIMNDDGTTTNQLLTSWNSAHNWTDIRVADVNGDGRKDIIGRSTLTGYDGNWYGALMNIDGSVTNQFLTNWNPAHNWANVMIGDVNGDGRDDMIGQSTLAGYVGNWYSGEQQRFLEITEWDDEVSPASLNGASIDPSGDEIDVTFDISGTGWAGLNMVFDTVQDFTAQNAIFGLYGINGTIKLEVEDSSGNSDWVYLSGIQQDNVRYFEITPSLFNNPDLIGTQIKYARFIIEQSNVASDTGTLIVGVDGLYRYHYDFLSNSDITNLPAQTSGAEQPDVALWSDDGTGQSVQIDDASHAHLNYDFTGSATWSAIAVNYGGADSADFSSIDHFVVGLRGESGTTQVKIEFQDANSNTFSTYVVDVNDTIQYYELPIDALVGANRSNIRYIAFIVETATVAAQLGDLDIYLDGFNYVAP